MRNVYFGKIIWLFLPSVLLRVYDSLVFTGLGIFAK